MQEKYYSPNSVEEKIYKDWEDQGAFIAPERASSNNYSCYTPTKCNRQSSYGTCVE